MSIFSNIGSDRSIVSRGGQIGNFLLTFGQLGGKLFREYPFPLIPIKSSIHFINADDASTGAGLFLRPSTLNFFSLYMSIRTERKDEYQMTPPIKESTYFLAFAIVNIEEISIYNLSASGSL